MSDHEEKVDKPEVSANPNLQANVQNQNQRYNNKHYNANRQNRQPYNKRNYGGKQTHSSQYNYNPAAAQAAYAGMYYNYYNYGYPMMPMYPPQMGQNLPNMSPTLPYNSLLQLGVLTPATGASPVPQFAPLGPGKIKITDKDGKQIDLEDKKKLSQKLVSATPILSPQKLYASPVKTHVAPVTVSTPTSIPAPAPAPAAAAASPVKDAVVEDFRDRIKRLAEAAKAKKEAEKAAKEGKVPEKQSEKSDTKHPEPEAAPKSEPVKEEIPESKPEPVPETKPVVAEPVESKPVVAEPEAVKEASEPAETKPVAESKPEEVVAEKAEASEPVSEPAADTETATDDIVESEDSQKKVEIQTPEDEEDEEPQMTLSQFFERVNEAENIEDPFSAEYPEPYVGVDSRWKSDTKKYRYDPQFLIQFQSVVQFQVDEEWKTKLAGLGIVAQNNQKKYSQKPGGKGGLPGRFSQMSGRGGQFERLGSRNGSKKRGGSSRDKSKRNNQSKRKDKDDEKSTPPEDVKPLEKSANRWVPRSSKRASDDVKYAPDGVTVILSEEDVERKVKSLLNKLTLEMFDTITDDILKIAEQSKWEEDAKTVKQVISLTFAKACDEPYWSLMYAQFCAKMCTKIPEEVSVTETTKDGKEVSIAGGALARRLLLTTCQQEYEKGWSDNLPVVESGAPLEMMSEEYYIVTAAKRRGLGLVKFIGQLYLLNMLTDKVVVYCLTNLSKNCEDPAEDTLESLAQLITAIGPKFEQSERNKSLMQAVFENIQKILDNVKLPLRIKFMLLDLKDLRAANWVSNKGETGPKTIKEIHDDAEIKRLEEEKAALERRRKNKGGDARSNSNRGGSGWGGQPKRVESSSRMSHIKDSNGFTAVSRSQSSRNEQSTLSPRETSKRSESLQSATNMFAALGGDDEHEHEHEQEPAGEEAS